MKGSEYETAASEVMNADIRNDLSAPLAAKHLIYQAAEGYDKVCTVRGMVSLSMSQHREQGLIWINQANLKLSKRHRI